MIFQKVKPVGLDKTIDYFQSKLFNKLSDLFSDDWECYPRIYKNKKSSNGATYFIPEFTEFGEEYEDVLFNDRVPVTSFFLKGDTINETNYIDTVTVSLIMSCNLKTIFPDIPHRADEEFKQAVVLASRGISNAFKLDTIEDEIDNVYSEFRNDYVQWDNIGDRHVVRFNFDVTYEYDCCC